MFYKRPMYVYRKPKSLNPKNKEQGSDDTLVAPYVIALPCWPI